jgi:hypothetical protein
VLAHINHNRRTDGLPCQAATATTWDYRQLKACRKRHRGNNVVVVTRGNHREWLNLVDRSVGCIQLTRHDIGPHLTAQICGTYLDEFAYSVVL